MKVPNWQQRDYYPAVTLIISVYNEEQVVDKKIENSLKLDYPKEKLEILVVSDGSTDRTHEIVQSYDDPRVSLRVFTDRAGKTECLNRVVPEVKGDIVVFTDANSMFPVEVLGKITRNFSDDAIGSVTGWTKYLKHDGGEETTGLYAKLEKVTKYGESLLSSCVGADGAIFAIRKELYLPLEDFDINDFVIPLNVVSQKKRIVLDPGVFCYEEPSAGELKEFRRQVRITNRTLGAIWRGCKFLNPRVFGVFALLLISHKIIRFLVPFFFLATLITSVLLINTSFFYGLSFVSQMLFISLGLAGLCTRVNGRLIGLSAFFLLTIAAQFVGWLRFVVGKRDIVWTPQR